MHSEKIYYIIVYVSKYKYRISSNNLGGRNMNRMRTPEEKEKILKDYLNGIGISVIDEKYQGTKYKRLQSLPTHSPIAGKCRTRV